MPFVSNLASSQPEASIIYHIPNLIKSHSPPPLNSRYTNHNPEQKLNNLSTSSLLNWPPITLTSMTNPRPETETANSPNSVLETPSGNNYSTHTTLFLTLILEKLI
ncbi:hypothetical protein BY996DRAFT_6556759, partial [Phakopsora pachyrhizi]